MRSERRTDRRDEANIRFSEFYERALKAVFQIIRITMCPILGKNIYLRHDPLASLLLLQLSGLIWRTVTSRTVKSHAVLK